MGSEPPDPELPSAASPAPAATFGRNDATICGCTFSSRICAATSRLCTWIDRGKSNAIRTRSPRMEAMRTTPMGFRGSPITTSSPSLRVMTSTRTSCPTTSSRRATCPIQPRVTQTLQPDYTTHPTQCISPIQLCASVRRRFAHLPKLSTGYGGLLKAQIPHLQAFGSPAPQSTASTRLISGTWSRRFFSIPVCNVTWLDGHPTHAPCKRICTTPSPVIETSSRSPPSACTAGRMSSRIFVTRARTASLAPWAAAGFVGDVCGVSCTGSILSPLLPVRPGLPAPISDMSDWLKSNAAESGPTARIIQKVTPNPESP